MLPYVQNVAERCEIILNGYAGDAILGGSFVKPAWWRAHDQREAGAALWRWRDCSLRPRYRRDVLGTALNGCTVEDARAAFIDCYLESPGSSPMDSAFSFLMENRVMRRTSCGTSLMRWRVESDQPFLDNDFFDLVMRVPHDWRFRHRLYLQMLRTCFKEAARIPWQRTGLPAGAPRWLMYLSLGFHRLERLPITEALFRSRQVSAFDRWMRGSLRDFVFGILADSRTLDRGLCDADTVRAVLDDHMSGLDNSALLGSLLAVELFARFFVDHDRQMLASCRVNGPTIKTIPISCLSPTDSASAHDGA